jgi:hypothetical protein
MPKYPFKAVQHEPVKHSRVKTAFLIATFKQTEINIPQRQKTTTELDFISKVCLLSPYSSDSV